MWFKDLFGFDEETYHSTQNNFHIEGDKLTSKINNRTFQMGTLEIPSLEQMRLKLSPIDNSELKIKVEQIVADVKQLHKRQDNEGALFQAASQFNLLEMVGPDICPEYGISRYQFDYTQGPACAIACGAGTVFRNYFVTVNGKIGQTQYNQINCLELLEKEFETEKLLPWKFENGYAFPSRESLTYITNHINQLSVNDREELKGKLKIGIQWNTEVTCTEEKNLVSQIYCSALPVSYSPIESSHWESFARLILEATYEATLNAAHQNYENSGNNKVFLTLVGGGAFGNKKQWILDAIEMSLKKYKSIPLDVKIVSYGYKNENIEEIIDRIVNT